MPSIGQAMRAARLRADLSQAELARLSGVPKNTIVCYEIDRSLFVQLSNILALAGALGISVEEYVGQPTYKRPVQGGDDE